MNNMTNEVDPLVQSSRYHQVKEKLGSSNSKISFESTLKNVGAGLPELINGTKIIPKTRAFIEL